MNEYDKAVAGIEELDRMFAERGPICWNKANDLVAVLKSNITKYKRSKKISIFEDQLKQLEDYSIRQILSVDDDSFKENEKNSTNLQSTTPKKKSSKESVRPRRQAFTEASKTLHTQIKLEFPDEESNHVELSKKVKVERISTEPKPTEDDTVFYDALVVKTESEEMPPPSMPARRGRPRKEKTSVVEIKEKKQSTRGRKKKVNSVSRDSDVIYQPKEIVTICLDTEEDENMNNFLSGEESLDEVDKSNRLTKVSQAKVSENLSAKSIQSERAAQVREQAEASSQEEITSNLEVTKKAQARKKSASEEKSDLRNERAIEKTEQQKNSRPPRGTTTNKQIDIQKETAHNSNGEPEEITDHEIISLEQPEEMIEVKTTETKKKPPRTKKAKAKTSAESKLSVEVINTVNSTSDTEPNVANNTFAVVNKDIATNVTNSTFAIANKDTATDVANSTFAITNKDRATNEANSTFAVTNIDTANSTFAVTNKDTANSTFAVTNKNTANSTFAVTNKDTANSTFAVAKKNSETNTANVTYAVMLDNTPTNKATDITQNDIVSFVNHQENNSPQVNGTFVVEPDKIPQGNLNETHVLPNTLNQTHIVSKQTTNSTVIEKAVSPVRKNSSGSVYEDALEQIQTEVKPSKGVVKKQVNKGTKPVFNPFENSPVKKKVEAFEKLGAQGAVDAPTRMTRTKTRNKAKALVESQDAEKKSQIPIPDSISRICTPSSESRYLPSSLSYSTSKAMKGPNTPHVTTTKTMSALKASQQEFREREQRRKEKEEDAMRKKEQLLKSQMEEKKRKREERELKVKQLREEQEKQKKKMFELQALKEEKLKRQQAEKQEKLAMMREEAEKKRQLVKQRNEELKREEEQRKTEDEKRKAEEAKWIRQEEERMKKLDEERRNEENEKRLLNKLRADDCQKPLYMTTEAPLLPTFDCYDSDDEEGQKKTAATKTPSWLRSEAMREALRCQEYVDNKLKNTLFYLKPQTANLREIFEIIDPKKLRRNSSAIWKHAPRFTLMPTLRGSDDDSDGF